MEIPKTYPQVIRLFIWGLSQNFGFFLIISCYNKKQAGNG